MPFGGLLSRRYFSRGRARGQVAPFSDIVRAGPREIPVDLREGCCACSSRCQWCGYAQQQPRRRSGSRTRGPFTRPQKLDLNVFLRPGLRTGSTFVCTSGDQSVRYCGSRPQSARSSRGGFSRMTHPGSKEDIHFQGTLRPQLREGSTFWSTSGKALSGRQQQFLYVGEDVPPVCEICLAESRKVRQGSTYWASSGKSLSQRQTDFLENAWNDVYEPDECWARSLP
mmetsp:Transcript_7427/g.23433  ORF Transcript_7427/g.23433 Transcript_7427/m.23433 type:complete len:226 (+) Transcript_7427:76-753(+)